MPRQRGAHVFASFAFAGVLALAALTTTRASAEESARVLDLEWSAPDGCPVREEVTARVVARVGIVRSPDAMAARGRVTTSRTGPRFELELSILGEEANTRTLRGDDCSYLVDAAAIIMALDIEERAHVRQGESQPPDASASALPPTTIARGQTRPTPLRRHRRERQVQLQGGARLTLDSGSLPRTAIGVGPLATLARDHLMLELQGIVFADRFTIVGPRSGRGGAYVGLVVASAHGCWRGIAMAIDWRGCIGGEVGLESTTGVSVAHPETATGLWSAASGMVGARLFPRQLISPTAGFAVAFPLAAPTVFIEGFGRVFQPPSAVVRGFIGLDVNFL